MALKLTTTTNPGRAQWSNDSSGGASGVVIWRPAGPADPDNGVYTLFSDAHAALAALGTGGWIEYDSPGVIANVDAAGSPYDMQNIYVRNFNLGQDPTPPNSSVQILGTVAFTNFDGNWEGLTVIWAGTATPLYAVDGITRLWRTGRGTRWATADGTTVEMMAATNAGLISIFMDDYSRLTGNTDGGQYELLSADATSFINVNTLSRCNVDNDVFRGDGTVIGVLGGNTTFDQTQTNLTNPVGVSAAPYPYFADNPANWNGDPTDAANAIDRLAASVAGLLGVPIP